MRIVRGMKRMCRIKTSPFRPPARNNPAPGYMGRNNTLRTWDVPDEKKLVQSSWDISDEKKLVQSTWDIADGKKLAQRPWDIADEKKLAQRTWNVADGKIH